ncbi:MAG: PRC-barrel domain-containing protein [Planctomycetes bacterium]|jgi:sporulation protein YlmC with PRC-barrel domain|nr:PRC-barrel domain-containing protein [Planctomycetota bacterium]
MHTFKTTTLLLTFVSGFVAAQDQPPSQLGPYAAAPTAQQLAMRSKASAMIGCAITNSKNESLGEIQDIVLDATNHRIAYAVVGFGGFLGMGEKYFALPWRLFEFAQRGSDSTPHATLGLDREALKAAPGFDKSNWPDMANPAWAGKVDEYYVGRNERELPKGAEEPKGSAKDGTRGVSQDPSSPAFSHRRLSQIIGTHVVDAAHNRTADVEDLVVDTQAGKIDGVLLSFGGTLGMGESITLVPVESLTFDTKKRVYVLPVDETQLAGMALKDGVWPTLNDDAWLHTGRAACLAARKANDAKPAVAVIDASARRHNARTAVYDTGLVETMSGTVTTIGSVATEEGHPEVLRLRVRLTDGRDMVVHAAPATFQAQRELGLRPGSKVEITGVPTKTGWRSVVLAGELKVDGKVAKLRDDKGTPTWLDTK